MFEKQININRILGRTFHINHLATLSGHISSIYCLADKIDTPYFFSAAGDGWIVQWEKDNRKTDGLLLAKVEGKVFSIIYIIFSHYINRKYLN